MKQTEKAVPEDWIAHLGGASRKPTGRIAPRDEGFVAADLPDRECSGTVDWLETEETLDGFGVRCLATPRELVTGSGTSKIYIAETTPDFVCIKKDDFNDINSDQASHTLPFPVPGGLLWGLPGH